MKRHILSITLAGTLGLLLAGLLLGGISPNVAQAQPPQAQAQGAEYQPEAACALLDDPTARGLMSAMFETKLLITCGITDASHGQRPATAAPDTPVSVLQSDVLVNDPTGDTGQSTTQSQTSIGVNPNTGTICSAYNDSQHWAQGSIGFHGFSSSTDGGVTFVDHGPFPAGGGGNGFGDPSLIWRQADGYFYYAALHSNGLGLWRSTDDCQTFSFFSMIHTGGGDDREMMAVDNSPASSYYGRIYVGWTDFAAGSQIYVTYSDDGLVWSAPVAVSAVGVNVQGAWPAVAPNGDVYVGWVRWNPYPTGPIDIEVVRSTDGGDNFTPVTNPLTGAVNPRDSTATSNCGRPALNADIRYLPAPQIAVGPDGCLHVVYSYDPDGYDTGDVVNVYYRRSCNNGSTWGTEVQLNDDVTLSDQWFPTISVGPSNILVSTWYDRRLDVANNFTFDYFKAFSYDGGLTWEDNIRVSDVSSSVPTLNPNFDPIVATCYHGDYDQQVQDSVFVYIQWSDDRNIQNAHPDPDIWFEKEPVLTETGTLTGLVYDADTMAPIAGAGVEAAGSLTFHTLSGGDGIYTMIAAPDTYDVTGSAFGYLSSTIPGVAVVLDETTVQDIGLTAAPSSVVDGYVTDSTTGWPLYAGIDTNSPAGIIWTDPETGYYSITLPDGTAFDFHVEAWVPGYIPEERTVGPLSGDTTQNFAMDADPATCSAPGYQKTYAFFDDFESGYGNWTATGLWNEESEANACGSLVAPFPSSDTATYYGQDGICTYDTGAHTSGELTLVSPVTLPGSGGTLEFYSYEETECGGDCTFDNRYVEISDDSGATWNPLGEGDTEDTWYLKAFDLSAYGNDDVLIRFRFDSVDSIGNAYFGWMVDDIGIVTSCEPQPGGLVVGNVYHETTLDPLVGAKVENDSGEETFALPTPGDPNVDEAFYTLFSPPGNHLFTASFGSLSGTDDETVAVIDSDTVSQDFYLPAPHLILDPEVLEAWLVTGTEVYTHVTGLDLSNDGSLPLDFELVEIPGALTVATSAVQASSAPANEAGARSGPQVERIEPIVLSSSYAAEAACLVAVTADSSSPTETAELHATLDEFGFSWVDVTTVTEARDAGANVLIDRYAGLNMPYADINDWLNDGYGYVELGDWPYWFPEDWEGQPAGTPLNITVADSSHPLANGLPPSWTGLGFWAYGWSSDAVGWVDDAGYPNVVEAQYTTLRERVVTAEVVGPGRAVYIGINTYGYLANDPDKQVLQNAIEWTCQDIPWFWEEPISDTVPVLSTYNVAIGYTALYPNLTPMPLGDYEATLAVKSNDPLSETQYVPVTMHIVEEFIAPTASFISNSPVSFGETVVFTSTSVEGLPPTESYTWDFGDGFGDVGEIASHTYAAPGIYTVTLTAHQAQTGVEVDYTDTVTVYQYIYLPIVPRD